MLGVAVDGDRHGLGKVSFHTQRTSHLFDQSSVFEFRAVDETPDELAFSLSVMSPAVARASWTGEGTMSKRSVVVVAKFISQAQVSLKESH